jgi:hypothetical protein
MPDVPLTDHRCTLLLRDGFKCDQNGLVFKSVRLGRVDFMTFMDCRLGAEATD